MGKIGTLTESAAMFVRGLPLAIALAVLGLGLSVLLGQTILRSGEVGTALLLAFVMYLHVVFVLVLTGWHMRERDRPWLTQVVSRASLRAAPVGVALCLFQLGLGAAKRAFHVGYEAANPTAADYNLIGDVLIYSQQSADFKLAGLPLSFMLWLTLWSVACGIDLPARLITGRASRQVWSPARAAVVFLPWLGLLYVVGWPTQAILGSYGFMEGGIILLPLLGAYMFMFAASCAAVSAAGRKAADLR